MPQTTGKRIFISVANREHQALRATLRDLLTRAGFDVVVQPDFPHTATDTVRKLDGLIASCDLVLHISGRDAGSPAAPAAVDDFFAHTDRAAFLSHLPEARSLLGDCSRLTYFQWEPWLALNRKIDVLVYAIDGHQEKDFPQRSHLDALYQARRHADTLQDEARRCAQVVADVCVHFGIVPGAAGRKIAPSRILRHAPKILFGRDQWLDALDAAWAKPTLNVYVLVAWGGVGKTSLVAHWVSQRLAANDWPGVERYFDWSFYSQGTGESRQTSADLFIQEALKFFDDHDPIQGSPWERGERLARLIRRHRTLLVLDGIEPLQYPPGDPQAGRLKDQALEALLQGLAADNPGLSVVTTREHLKNIENQATTEEQKLDRLVKEAAIALLRHLQIAGTEAEMEAAWKDAGGHALTLQLLGRFIADAYEDRDICHYKEVKFEAADLEREGRSAFKVMIAYERWLQAAGPERQRELAVLRLTGLFDRPMSRDCLLVLRKWDIPWFFQSLFSGRSRQIARTFGPLANLSNAEVNIVLNRLAEVDLLTVTPEAIDAHPLIREYFARQLRDRQPAAFKEAHSRLFEHLCRATRHRPDTLDGLQPLYQAVVHGCLAGRQQQACNEVYLDRILHGTGDDGFYSTDQLGAFGADLAAVAAFFDRPWSHVSPNLSEVHQAWLLSVAAFNLRALGRPTEALQPIRASLEMAVRQKRWRNAASRAGNLSDLEVTLGRLPDAVADARRSIVHADQSGDAFQRMAMCATAGDALHQSGQRAEAGTLFAQAERIVKEIQPEFDLLNSVPGCRYCDWLLAPAERAAWQALLRSSGGSSAVVEQRGQDGHASICAEVERRGKKMLQWRAPNDSLLAIALYHLMMARVGLARAMLTYPLPQPALDLPHVAAAVNGLRNAGQMDELPKGLLTAALYHFVRGDAAAARTALAEAQAIAERGPMPLYLADVHLHRVRLFRDKAELAKAARFIRDLGYGRRYDELADAEAALAGDQGTSRSTPAGLSGR